MNMATSLARHQPPNVFADRFVQAAVSQVEFRAEHQQSADHLAATFVDPGIAVQIENDNSQIVYGRRGTGKTHLLKVTQRVLQMREPNHRLSVYVDMRNLGSSCIFEDTQRQFSVRAASLLRDVLEQLHAALLGHLTAPHVHVGGHAFQALDEFAAAIVRTVLQDETTTLQTSREHSTQRTGDVTATLSATPGLSLGRGRTNGQREGRVETIAGRRVERLHFGELAVALADVLEEGAIRHLTLLLDEWSHVPYDLQPLLAEFLRKALLALPTVSIKIASLEYRSNFRERRDDHHNVIGFEMGADISAALELDEFYLYSHRRSRAADLFADLLIRHISTEVDRQAQQPGYFARVHGFSDRPSLIAAVFSGEKTFHELVRAGECVARDYMNVFAKAYFAAVRDGRRVIDLELVREAASEWYELDKVPNIEDREEAALRLIVEQVIARCGTATFLLSRKQERSPLIRSLVDLRLMHCVQRGVRPYRHDPANRYNVYALDYGVYAHLMGTDRAPQTLLYMHGNTKPLVVLDELVKRLDDGVAA
jgi:hypothetical protein